MYISLFSFDNQACKIRAGDGEMVVQSLMQVITKIAAVLTSRLMRKWFFSFPPHHGEQRIALLFVFRLMLKTCFLLIAHSVMWQLCDTLKKKKKKTMLPLYPNVNRSAVISNGKPAISLHNGVPSWKEDINWSESSIHCQQICCLCSLMRCKCA